jgi:outer membrane protein TolC
VWSLVTVAWAVLLFSGGSLSPAGAQGLQGKPLDTLPLTREDVAYLALLNSRDLKVERFNSRIIEQDIANERSAFHPIASMESSGSRSTSLSGSALSGSDMPQVDTANWSSGIRARLISGATASFDFVNSHVDNNSTFLLLNPTYQSSLTFTLTQPLLKNFGPSVNAWRIKVAVNNAGISRYQLEAKVANALTDAENTYWDLAMTFKDLEIRRRALDLTRGLAKRTEELVSEGIVPETALLQAKTTVLQREADVLGAQNALQDTRSRLKDLLNFAPGGDPLIVPLDQPSADARSIDIEQAVKDALAKRPELPQVRLDVKNKDVILGYAKNQVLPQLNLFGSYGLMGLAGEPTAITGPTLTIPIAARRTVTVEITDLFVGASSAAVGDYQTALGNLFSGNYPTWKVGVNLTYPLGNVAAESQLKRAELELQKAELTVKNVERAIALEVQRLGNQIQSIFKVIEAARSFREQAQVRLNVMRDEFQLGMVSLSTVHEAQRDLVTAEREEWKTIVDYNKLIVLFERATGAMLERYRVDL